MLLQHYLAYTGWYGGIGVKLEISHPIVLYAGAMIPRES